MRHFSHGTDNLLGRLQATPTIGARPDVLAERLNAESGFVVQE